MNLCSGPFPYLWIYVCLYDFMDLYFYLYGFMDLFALFVLQDEAYEEKDRYGDLGKIEYTGGKVTRYCLVLDCLVAHDYRYTY